MTASPSGAPSSSSPTSSGRRCAMPSADDGTWPRRLDRPGPEEIVAVVMPERMARLFEERCLGRHTVGRTRLSPPLQFSEGDLPSYIIEVEGEIMLGDT